MIDIEVGLDEILNLFEIPFPRTISTLATLKTNRLLVYIQNKKH